MPPDRSESSEPTLTVHWPGNATSRADLGGSPKSLAFTDPQRLHAALLALDEAREAGKLNYALTMEATHHRPTELGVPTLFVEIESTETPERHRCRSRGQSRYVDGGNLTEQGELAVGFEGGHYCNKHCLTVREEGYTFSHILSKYYFEEYDKRIVRMAFERTREECRTAVID